MADTLLNITITENRWVDVYALSGVAVGTAISVDNVGDCDISLAVQAAQPAQDHDAFAVVKRAGPPYRNSSGDSGAWAFCQGSDGKLNVRAL